MGRYASALFSHPVEPLPEFCLETASHIGLDYASHGLYVDSNGESCGMPGVYRAAEKKLVREQRRLSRKQPGSANREKQRRRLAKTAVPAKNQRTDFLHKKSAWISERFGH